MQCLNRGKSSCLFPEPIVLVHQAAEISAALWLLGSKRRSEAAKRTTSAAQLKRMVVQYQLAVTHLGISG